MSNYLFPDLFRSTGEAAAEACAAKAERETAWDRDGAMDFVMAYIATHGPVGGEAVVNAAKKAGFVPHDDRAFGAVFGSLVRRGSIVCVGFGCREKGHGTAGMRIWALPT